MGKSATNVVSLVFRRAALLIIAFFVLLILFQGVVRLFVLGIKSEIYEAAAPICQAAAAKLEPDRVKFGCYGAPPVPVPGDPNLSTLACDPVGFQITEAAKFENNPGIHPIVVLDYSGAIYGSRLGLGDDWNPDSIDKLELVLCVSADEIDDTLYNEHCNGDYYNYFGVATKKADLFEAQTGKFVTGFSLRVSHPCGGNPETTLEGIKTQMEILFNVK
jgi:hypothetical protein